MTPAEKDRIAAASDDRRRVRLWLDVNAPEDEVAIPTYFSATAVLRFQAWLRKHPDVDPRLMTPEDIVAGIAARLRAFS